MNQVANGALRWSRRLNIWVERLCVGILVVLVLDVWLGVLVRYVISLPITFTEELARYLMIWMALLAVSCGISQREHIGVLVLFERFPHPVRKWLVLAFDAIAFLFFGFLLVYGLGFVERGFSRLTMIYDIPKGWPFIGVPLSAALACAQLVLVAVHDYFVGEGVIAVDRADM